MIAKRILTPKGGSGYQRLSGYVLNVRQEHREATDPASWTRLGAYILDASNAGEKVAWARATNCGHDDPGWAVKGILAVQAQNTRSQSDKSYHLVVSFPEGERPTRAQMEDIEDRLCEALGFGDHQRVSAVHQNTDNWHLHVAVNKVHPVTLRNVTPIRDHFRLQAACLELEIKHGLTQEPHTVDFTQSRERKARGRAVDFEARHGGQSFLAWTQEHARPALLAALGAGRSWPEDSADHRSAEGHSREGGWQALHQVAALYDLELKPRGAGLVISHRSDGRLNAKASDVDRGLSLAALTARLGPYAAPDGAPEPASPNASYQRPAPDKTLYAAFEEQREEAKRAREAARLQLAERHVAYARELAAWYRKRIRLEHSQQLRGALRRESFQHIAAERERDRVARVERERGEREAMRAAHPVPNWRGYLEAEAQKGNPAAAEALRNRRSTGAGVKTTDAGVTSADRSRRAGRDDRGDDRGR